MTSPARHEALSPEVTARSARETVANALRALARWLPIVPGLGVAIHDATVRRAQIAQWSRASVLSYVATLTLGALLWGGLVTAASERRGLAARLLLLAGAIFAIGAQLYFFGRYHAYMNPRAVLVGTSMLPSVGQQIWSDRLAFLRAVLPPVVLCALVVEAHRRASPVSPEGARRALDVAVAALLVSAFGSPVAGASEQAASPDLLYLASLGRLATARWRDDPGVLGAHPGVRTPARCGRSRRKARETASFSS
jgi:hypothetical protein